MKNKVYSIYLKIISACLVWLGFNACDSNNDDNGCGDCVAEYGVPSATYKIIGEVVSSEDKTPIPAIQVVITSPYEEEGDTTYTNKNGVFEIDKYAFPSAELTAQFKDIDGEENGLFTDKEVTIDLKDVKYEGGGSWYKGHADIDMETIHLDPKEPEEPEEPEEPNKQ